MKQLFVLLVAMGFLMAPLFSQTTEAPEDTISGVRVRILDTNLISPNQVPSEVQAIFDTHNVIEFKQAFPRSNRAFILQHYLVSCNCNPVELKTDLFQTGYFDEVKVGSKIYTLTTPNDFPVFGIDDYALVNIKAQEAWDITHGSPDVIIGISDMGFDTNHPELTGTVNFYNINTSNHSGEYSDIEHGTRVATTAAGNTDNLSYKSHIGWNCSLSLHGSLLFTADASSTFDTFYEAAEEGARIINMSWVLRRSIFDYETRCSPDEVEQAIINELTEDFGVFFVGGAGNGAGMEEFGGSITDGCNLPTAKMYPASYDNVFSVTSVNENDHNTSPDISTPHQYNEKVDLCAPGYNVVVVNPATTANGGPIAPLAFSSGTSLAAPYVSGTAGLMLSVNPCLRPVDLERILKENADDIQELNPDSYVLYNTFYEDENGNPQVSVESVYGLGAGRLNAFKAVSRAEYLYQLGLTMMDYPDGIVVTSNNQIIEDQDGDGIIRIGGPVIIKDGVSNYKITNKIIEFQRNHSFGQLDQGHTKSGIIVEPNAKLTILNCTLKGPDYTHASCSAEIPEPDKMWDGIQVWGDPDVIAQPDDETASRGPNIHIEFIRKNGQLIVKNSVIQDAEIGVACYRRNIPFIATQEEYGRGYLEATNTTFKNNNIGVRFGTNRKSLVPNNSKIVRCNFISDAPLISDVTHNGDPSFAFISVNNVYGPKIYGNKFIGKPEYAEAGKVIGIVSNNAAYDVTVAPPQYIIAGGGGGNTTRNEFRDLFKGIDINSIGGANRTIRVKESDFNNVFQGITSTGSNFDEISFNKFNIRPGNLQFDSWGIFLRGTIGYLVTENEFNGPAVADQYTFGSVIRNTSLMDSEVYRNTYNGSFMVATQSEQNNQKLQIRCNTYNGDNEYDWAITSGQLANQGECNTQFPNLAANNFFGYCDETFGYHKQIRNPLDGGAVPFMFLYSSFENELPHPSCKSNSVNLIDCGENQAGLSFVNYCPPKATITPNGNPAGLAANWRAHLIGLSNQEKERFKRDNIRNLAAGGNIADIIMLLNEELLPEDKMLLIPTLLGKGDCEQAFELLQSLVVDNLSKEKYVQLYTILTTLCSTDRRIEELTEAELADVMDVRDSETTHRHNAEAVILEYEKTTEVYYPERFASVRTGLTQSEDETEDYYATGFKLFPNPTDNKLHLNSTELINGTVTIFSTDGKLVSSYNVFDVREYIVNTSEFENGVYFMTLLDNKSKQTQQFKFVVQH